VYTLVEDVGAEDCLVVFGVGDVPAAYDVELVVYGSVVVSEGGLL
jgi:hypothetical protein